MQESAKVEGFLIVMTGTILFMLTFIPAGLIFGVAGVYGALFAACAVIGYQLSQSSNQFKTLPYMLATMFIVAVALTSIIQNSVFLMGMTFLLWCVFYYYKEK